MIDSTKHLIKIVLKTCLKDSVVRARDPCGFLTRQLVPVAKIQYQYYYNHPNGGTTIKNGTRSDQIQCTKGKDWPTIGEILCAVQYFSANQ